MNKISKIFVILSLVLINSINAQVRSQKIGNNPTIINGSAALEIESTNKGVLIPRVSLTGTGDTTTIPGSAESLLVFNTNTTTGTTSVTPGYYYWVPGTPTGSWVRIVSSNSLAAATTNALNSPTDNTITSTVNGVTSTPAVTLVKTVSNALTGTTLTTTVNGVGSTVNLNGLLTGATTHTLASTGNTITSTVNGVIAPLAASPPVTLVKDVSNTSAANLLSTTVNGITSTPVPMVNTISNTLTGTNLTTIVNGINSMPLDIKGLLTAPGATTHTLTNSDAVAINSITSTVNGVAATAPAVRSVENTLTGSNLVTKVNGIAGAPVNISAAELDGFIGNEVVNATPNGGLTLSGTGTAAAGGTPLTLGITPGTLTGQVVQWDGTKWAPATLPPTAANTNIYNSNGILAGGFTTVANITGTTNFRRLEFGAGNGLAIAGDLTSSLLLQGPKLANWSSFVINANADGGTTVGNEDIIFQVRDIEHARIKDGGNVGLGVVNPTSRLHTAGPIATPVISVSANITLDNTHSLVRIDATAGNRTVILPAATTVSGRMYTITKTDDTSNRIIFNTTPTNILGAGFMFTELNIQGTYHIQSDGTNWLLVD